MGCGACVGYLRRIPDHVKTNAPKLIQLDTYKRMSKTEIVLAVTALASFIVFVVAAAGALSANPTVNYAVGSVSAVAFLLSLALLSCPKPRKSMATSTGGNGNYTSV